MQRARARGAAALVSTLALIGASVVAAPAALAAPAVSATSSAEITVGVTPGSATEGEVITVTVAATEVVDLFAYDLAFAYDPALLSFDETSLVTPEGGFSGATLDDTTVTVAHSRLGTSPGLATSADAPTLPLASFSFTVIGAGDTAIALASASLVDSAGETLELTDLAEVAVSLEAVPAPAPEPTATASPTPSVTPTPAATGDTGAPASSGPLAATGADSTPWLIAGAVAVVLLAAGVVLVLRRRRAVTE